MKVYFIYFKSEKINTREYPGINPAKITSCDGGEYTLYAFTEKEDRMKIFRLTRNMNLFFVRSEKMEKEEFLDIMCNDYYAEFYLDHRSISTEVETSNGTLTSSYVQILMTSREFNHIFHKQDEIFTDIISDYDSILYNKVPSYIFKKSYEEALEFSVMYSANMMPENNLDDDVPWVPQKYNLLALYCNQYKNTYLS